jgi:hypothetical protein
LLKEVYLDFFSGLDVPRYIRSCAPNSMAEANSALTPIVSLAIAAIKGFQAGLLARLDG